MHHPTRKTFTLIIPTLGALILGLIFALAPAFNTPAGSASAATSQPGPALRVDVSADRHPISPDIYGMNYPDPALATALGMSVQRWGGNQTSRYNWQANIDNKGSDYYFENIPVGQSADAYIDQGRAAGTRTLLTVPAIGWVARADSPRTHPYACGFTQAGQDSYDAWDTRCGNGLIAGQPVTGNAPTDTSTASGPAFVQAWAQHLVSRYGAARAGGVPYYAIDNEPGIWNLTHRDVHPQPATFQELYDKAVQYGAAIKAADPSAQVLGPVQDGWTRYLYAAYVNATQANADRAANGNVDFVPWYLAKLRQYEQQSGVRVLDYLDLHYYPQAGGVALGAAGDATTQALRLRSTRSLWDPSYQDESWINTTQAGGVAVQLILRMRQWVATAYPGTKTALTEYNWGALDHINGALAQADVLGIFGREQLDLATLWAPPTPTQPGAFAFRMYRNYDGQGGAFGETGVRASSADQGQLAIYAAQRARDGALTIVVINKAGVDLTSTLSLVGATAAASAQAYRYSDANLSAIVNLGSLPLSGASLSASFPANSITTLVVLPASAPAPPTVTPAPPTATATPAPTAPTQTSGLTLGYTTIGASADTGDSNYINGSRFVTGATGGAVYQMSVNIGTVSAAPNNQYQLAIYTDAGGRPGSLIATSTVGTLKANTWNSLPIAASLQGNTAYWLVYNTNGTNTNDNNMKYDVNGIDAYSAAPIAFGTWPSAFGTSVASNLNFSIYASYTTSAPPTATPALPTATPAPPTATPAPPTATPALPTATPALPTATPALPTATPAPPTATPAPPAAITKVIYADSLAAGWANLSWNSTVQFSSTGRIKTGNASIAITLRAAWAGFYLHNNAPVGTGGYSKLRFWINGGASGGQKLVVVTRAGNGGLSPQIRIAAPTTGWTLVEVPLAQLGSPASLSEFFIQDASGSAQKTFYVDQIELGQ